MDECEYEDELREWEAEQEAAAAAEEMRISDAVAFAEEVAGEAAEAGAQAAERGVGGGNVVEDWGGFSAGQLEELFEISARDVAGYGDVGAVARAVGHGYRAVAPGKHHVCVGGDVILMFQQWDRGRRGRRTLNVQQVEVRPSVRRTGVLTRTLGALEAAFAPDVVRMECVVTETMRAFCAARGFRQEALYGDCYVRVLGGDVVGL